MKKSSLVLISSMLSISCLAQIRIPSMFKKLDSLNRYSDKWYFLNASNLEYQVENINGKLEVKINNDFKDFELKLSDGKLIGTNYPGDSEYFYFQPIDTINKKISIKKGNVLFAFIQDDKIFFIESIETDTDTKGYLYQLDRIKGDFVYKKLIEFNDTPTAFLVNKNILYLATNESLLIIDNLNPKVIFEKTSWKGLYPNSIAYFDDENVFLGIRGGIVKLNLKTKSINFYESEDNYK